MFRLIYTFLLCVFSAVFFTITYCGATNYYVETGGSSGNNGLSVTSAWPNIYHALQYVADGDVVYVGVGAFTSDWLFVNNEVTIMGSDIYNPDNPPLSRHTSRTVVSWVPATNQSQSSLMEINARNVVVRNITFDGFNHPRVGAGVWSRRGGATIEYCTVRNIENGYGMLCSSTNSSVSALPDSQRTHCRYNLVTNITGTNATGMYFERVPFTCANNEFSTITGLQSLAGVYVHKCYLTNGSSDWVSIDSNYFYNCDQSIWANNFGGTNQQINIRDNHINASLVGIRVTSADGQATITSNTIYVGGISLSSNATPARGIWVQADTDPWGAMPTDHQIVNNTITDTSTSTGTVGLLLEYDAATWTNINNGVHATVLSNSVNNFYTGMYVEAGTNGVKFTNHPLVVVTANYNDFNDNRAWAIVAEGVTNTLDVNSNWMGVYYTNPASVISGSVDFSGYIEGGAFYLDTDNDGVPDYLDDDDDGDGLSDIYEVFVTGTKPNRADTDGDGQTDREEHVVTGTDPLDPYSVFKITVSPGSSLESFEFSWPSASNRLYDVYRTTNLNIGFGAPISNNITATPPTNTFIDTNFQEVPQYYMVTVTNAP